MNLTSRFLAECTNGIWLNHTDKELTISAVFTDTREKTSGGLFIALAGDRFDAHDFLEDAVLSGTAALCVQEDKYKPELNSGQMPVLAVKDTLKAFQNIAKAYRRSLKNLILIGITGSNGKTSVKEILSQVLAQAFGAEKVYATMANTNNHIGVPQNIFKLSDVHKYAVIELGTNHPGEIEVLADIARPDIAIITSIGESHLEFFGDVNGVAEEKANIFNYLGRSPDTLAIVPDKTLTRFAAIKNKLTDKNFLTFASSEDGSADITYREISSTLIKSSFYLKWKDEEKFHNVQWSINGVHQMGNASIAALAASYLGVEREKISQYLTNARLTGMRMKIRKSGITTIINDAYNANPASAKAGIIWLSQVIGSYRGENTFVVLGDMLELGSLSLSMHIEVLSGALTLLSKCRIITVGRIMREAADSIANSASFNPILSFPDSVTAAEYFKTALANADLIYLKGSRGTKLELIDSVFPEQNYSLKVLNS